MNAGHFKGSMGGFEGEFAEYKKEEERRLMGFLSERHKIPILTEDEIDPSALQLITEQEAREAKMAVYRRLKGVLSIAVHEPKNPKLLELIRQLEKNGYSCKLALTTTSRLENLWSYYQDIISTSATVPGHISITNEELEHLIEGIENLDDVRALLERTKNLPATRKISKNIEYILFPAVSLGISDVHLEATSGGGVVRYRVDGVLVDVTTMEAGDFKKFVTRLKLTSQMKISTQRAQDGAFVISFPNKSVSVRASVIPGAKGESFVLRILDPDNVIHDVSHLGLHKEVLKVFERNILKPNGLILTTGPTGSGKTTTLYSFLNMIKDKDVKVITLEDPVEYRLEGIVQTQIKRGYSFAGGLRAILRQDPDVILVGEIRDEEVAEITVQASLTGHLVFSTLHTNDAVGAIHRLTLLGVDVQLLARAVNIVIAQRLVRLLCPHCSEKHILTDEQTKEIEARIEQFPAGYRDADLSVESIRRPGERADVCKYCTDGYKGRMGIFEVFEMTSEVEKVCRSNASVGEIVAVIRKQGSPFLEDDCLWKVLKGKTSLAEMGRVLGIHI